MKSKIFGILFILAIVTILPIIEAETLSLQAKAKISSTLLGAIEQTPEKRTNIIIVPKSEKMVQKLGVWNWLCQKFCNWLCNLLCGSLGESLVKNEFELEAITSEGYIIGSIPAKNIGKLAESKDVKAILSDYYIVTKISSAKSVIVKELKEMNTTSIQSSEEEITATASLNQTTESGTIIRLTPQTKVKPKLWGIIPMFWKK